MTRVEKLHCAALTESKGPERGEATCVGYQRSIPVENVSSTSKIQELTNNQ